MKSALLFIATFLTFSIAHVDSAKPQVIHAYEQIKCDLSLDGKNVPLVSHVFRGKKASDQSRYKQNDILFDVEKSVTKDSVNFKINVYQIIHVAQKTVTKLVGSSVKTLSLDPNIARQAPDSKTTALRAITRPATVQAQLGSLNGILIAAVCTFPGVLEYAD